MEVTLKVKLQPFKVPNYVLAEVPFGRREEGIQEGPKYSLEDLDAETLDRLCDEFRNAVFLKAKKSLPPQPR